MEVKVRGSGAATIMILDHGIIWCRILIGVVAVEVRIILWGDEVAWSFLSGG